MSRAATDPTDNTTPRVRAELAQALIDLNEVINRSPDAVRRLGNAQPGYPTAPASTIGRTINATLEDRNGIVHWSCPVGSCGHDPTARGRAVTEGAAQRAFLAHHADVHTNDPSTQPERYAVLGGDEAVRDLAEFLACTRRIARDTRRARDLASKWGTTLVGAKVADPADSEWCSSCRRANKFSARRREGGDLCRWCQDKLRAVNTLRAERGLQAMAELPLAAVQAYARGDAVYLNHIERWADLRGARTP